jgi:hypothetical protein
MNAHANVAKVQNDKIETPSRNTYDNTVEIHIFNGLWWYVFFLKNHF